MIHVFNLLRYNRPSHIVDVACENDAKVHLLLFLQQQRMMHTTISSRLRWRSELLALALMSTGENVILCDDVSKLLRISFPRRRYTQQRPIQ